MLHKLLGVGAASLLFASAYAQTQEEIEAYPEYAAGFGKFNMTWESIKLHTDDGYTLTMFHVTGTEDGPINVTKPAVIM